MTNTDTGSGPPSTRMKLLIIGHGRHGKDTLAELLREVGGWTFASSSEWCADKVVRPAMADIGVDYPSSSACFEDRANHREFWKYAISEYNQPKDRLVKEILAVNDIYVGLRSRDEFEASRHHFDRVIWVDRSCKLPPDPTCDLLPADADIQVDNNAGLVQLRRAAISLSGDLQRLKG